MSQAKASLKSAGVSKWLIYLLWARLGLAIACSLFSLIEVVSPSLYKLFALFNSILSIATLAIILSSLILLWIWLHRLHADLKVLFQGYPIRPWGAVARFLIPIYSLWGMANTLTTFADRFKPEGGDLTDFSTKVRSSIAPLYAVFLGTNAWNRLLQAATKNSDGENLAWMYLVSYVIDIATAFVLLSLIKLMQTATSQKLKRAIA